MPRRGSIPGGDRVTDAGLAIERTTLAWTRSGLAMGVTGAFTVKAAVGTPVEELGYVAGALIIVAGAGVWAYAGSRYQRGRAALVGAAPGAVPIALRRLARATLACCIAALLLVAVFH